MKTKVLNRLPCGLRKLHACVIEPVKDFKTFFNTAFSAQVKKYKKPRFLGISQDHNTNANYTALRVFHFLDCMLNSFIAVFLFIVFVDSRKAKKVPH